MLLRVSGRWSDLSLPVAEPAHSTSVSDSSYAVLLRSLCEEVPGLLSGSVRRAARRQPRRAAVRTARSGQGTRVQRFPSPEPGVAPQERSPGQQLPPPDFRSSCGSSRQHVKSHRRYCCRRHLGKNNSSNGGRGSAGTVNRTTGRLEGQGTLSALTAPAGLAPCVEPCPSPRPRAAHGAAPEQRPILP